MNARITIGALVVVAVLGIVVIGSRTSYTSMQEALLSYMWKSELEVTADAWLVLDITNNRIISEQNADEEYPIASITKLFTAYAASKSEVFDEDLVISKQDIDTEGGSGSLRVEQQYSVRDLLFPLLLVSSNDAAEAIVRHVGQTTIDSQLQSLLQEAELRSTSIDDASGLSSENISTPRDLAVFVEYLQENDPYVLDITRLPTYLGPHGGWRNNNPGFGIDGFNGGKHGYTSDAGRTFAGLFHIEGYYKEADFVVILLRSDHLENDLKIIHELIKRKVW